MKLGRNHELVFIPWKRKGIISSWETKILKDRFLWKEDGDMRLFNSDFMKVEHFHLAVVFIKPHWKPGLQY